MFCWGLWLEKAMPSIDELSSHYPRATNIKEYPRAKKLRHSFEAEENSTTCSPRIIAAYRSKDPAHILHSKQGPSVSLWNVWSFSKIRSNSRVILFHMLSGWSCLHVKHPYFNPWHKGGQKANNTPPHTPSPTSSPLPHQLLAFVSRHQAKIN